MPCAELPSPSLRLYYELRGDGPVKLILIQGIAGIHSDWRETVDDLLRLDSQLQICIFDNRGVGLSDVTEGRYTTSEMADDTMALVDYLGWDKLHVAGMSMGGMIAQEMALRYPERILSLALLSTHAGRKGNPKWKTASLFLRKLHMKSDEERVDISISMLHPDEWLDEIEGRRAQLQLEWLERLQHLGQDRQEGIRNQVMAHITHRVGKKRATELVASGIPILVVHGAKDILINVKAAYWMHKIFEPAETIIFEGAGHGVFIERLEQVDRAILRNIHRGQSMILSRK